MRFRSELLQPPKDGAGATLNKIYNVYRTPDGHFAGDENEDEDWTDGFEDAGLTQTGSAD
jgi:hypothetical protein